jgi:hypothetical protein
VKIEYMTRGQKVEVDLTGIGNMNCPLDMECGSLPTPPTPTVVTECDMTPNWVDNGENTSIDGVIIENREPEVPGEFFETDNPDVPYTI